MGSPFLVRDSLMEEADKRIVGLAEIEQDKTFNALTEERVFNKEEVLAVMKDDFFI